MHRKIKKIISGEHTTDGAGVRLKRISAHNDASHLDPFLLFDVFDSTNPDDYIRGFPMHPHRGIETVTYLLDGEIRHEDSLGNNGVIGAGDCQWMTAGRGILHEEMPQRSKRLWGAQLWVNLPAKYKMTAPKYHDIPSSAIPFVKDNGVEVRVVAGQYAGHPGTVQSEFSDINYLDVTLSPGAQWRLDTPPEDTLFISVFSGEVSFDEKSEQSISAQTAVIFDDGGELYAKALENGARFLLMSGPKLNEPVAWGGPIVMNTRSELNEAFRELKEGTFIK